MSNRRTLTLKNKLDTEDNEDIDSVRSDDLQTETTTTCFVFNDVDMDLNYKQKRII